MSSYTTALLITRYSIQPAKVQELNAILKIYDTSTFEQAGDTGWLWMAEANYMPCADIIEAVNSIEWERHECVQLFFCSEHNDKFTEAELKPNAMPGYAYFVTTVDENETWSLDRDRPAALPVVEAVKKALGRIEPLLVRFSVASRVSEEAVETFINCLSHQERDDFNKILDELEEGKKDD